MEGCCGLWKAGVPGVQLEVHGEATSCFAHVHTHSPSSVDNPAIPPAAWAGLHCPLLPLLRGECLAAGWPGMRWGH